MQPRNRHSHQQYNTYKYLLSPPPLPSSCSLSFLSSFTLPDLITLTKQREKTKTMASQDEILLAAILKQVTVTKINYEQLAKDIGAVSAGAASKRWRRYQGRLKGAVGS
ncbi:uncharacterized protein LY89DRAFT_692319, partial [Mollisia scopiformis]